MRAIQLTDTSRKSIGFWHRLNFKFALLVVFMTMSLIAAGLVATITKIVPPAQLSAAEVIAQAIRTYKLDLSSKMYLETAYTVVTDYKGHTDNYSIVVNSLLDRDNGFIQITQYNNRSNNYYYATYPLNSGYFNIAGSNLQPDLDEYNFYSQIERNCDYFGYSSSRVSFCVKNNHYLQFYPKYDVLKKINIYDEPGQPNSIYTDSVENVDQFMYLNGFRKVDATHLVNIVYGDLNPNVIDPESRAEKLIFNLINSFTDFRIDREALLNQMLQSPAFTFNGLTQYKGIEAYYMTLNTSYRKLDIYIDKNSFTILSMVEYDHSISDTKALSELELTKYQVSEWKGFSTQTSTNNGLKITNYDNKDYTVLQELSDKIEKANLLLNSIKSYSVIKSTDKTRINIIVDNKNQTITFIGTEEGSPKSINNKVIRPIVTVNKKFENGKLFDLINNVEITRDEYGRLLNKKYGDYLPYAYNAGSYALSDLIGSSSYEGTLVDLGINSQQKVIDSTGATTYTFNAKFRDGASSSLLDFIFEPVTADWMTEDGNYTYKFDSTGRLISAITPFNSTEYLYTN